MSAVEGGSHNANLQWLFALQRFGMRVDLGPTRELLAAVGDPQLSYAVTLVGGTNGKGSVAALLAAQLGAAGVRAGLFTSPHLQSVGERVKVAGENATEGEMESLVGLVRPAAEEIGATFFEALTAAALLAFKRARVEHAVLEVGLGGRLDSTNAVDPVLTVISNVSLDHTQVLGTDVREIALDKAGILRPGVPLVTGAAAAPLEVIRGEAQRVGAPVMVLGEEITTELLSSSWEGLRFDLNWRKRPPKADSTLIGGNEGHLQLSSPLVGQHQTANIALSVVAGSLLSVPTSAAVEAVAGFSWPARLERLSYEGRHVVLDGAHNPAAAGALRAVIRELEGQADVMIIGLSADKDLRGVLSEWVDLARRVIFTHALKSPRSAPPSELLALWTEVSGGRHGELAEVKENPADALARAVELSSQGATVVAAGSLFLAGELRDLLTGATPESFERWQ